MGKITKYKTISAYISGGICGRLWMPCSMAGKPFNKSLRGFWGIMDKERNRTPDPNPYSFREALNRLLMNEGGDFRDAKFSADTVLRVERRTVIDDKGRYSVHVFERELIELWNCRDLVNEEYYTSDFLGDE